MPSTPSALPSAALRRLARHRVPAPAARGGSAPAPASPDVEHCDLCADQLPDRHRHLLDTGRRQILCACQACGVLFDRQAAGNGLYRLIRPLRRALPDLRCDGALWAALGVPVDLAFFVRHEAAPAEPATTEPDAAGNAATPVTAHYPSPIGTVGAEVAPEAWQRLVEANALLADMDTEVVALLIRQQRRTGDRARHGASQQWLLGIDDCYQLTALLRQSWTGLSGGDQVWRQIDAYFDRLREEAAL